MGYCVTPNPGVALGIPVDWFGKRGFACGVVAAGNPGLEAGAWVNRDVAGPV